MINKLIESIMMWRLAKAMRRLFDQRKGIVYFY